jgi:hypothetical protein
MVHLIGLFNLKQGVHSAGICLLSTEPHVWTCFSHLWFGGRLGALPKDSLQPLFSQLKYDLHTDLVFTCWWTETGTSHTPLFPEQENTFVEFSNLKLSNHTIIYVLDRRSRYTAGLYSAQPWRVKQMQKWKKIKPNRVCEKEILTYCRKGGKYQLWGKGERGIWFLDRYIDRCSEVNFLNFSTN